MSIISPYSGRSEHAQANNRFTDRTASFAAGVSTCSILCLPSVGSFLIASICKLGYVDMPVWGKEHGQ